MAEKFTITFSGSSELDINSIWPDGDAPASPTVHDVAKAMEKGGGKIFVIRDWDLEQDIVVEVSGTDHAKVWQ